MSDRTKVTFIRVTNRLEATRSPVDGKWRAHALVVDPTLSQDDIEWFDARDAALPLRWVTLGVAPKAAAAIAQAQAFLA
jgi:hypothetical protein